MRILIAEDADANALVLTRTLEKRGHSVVRVTNGLDALEQLKSGELFDAVVTDWMMPKLDGVGFIRRARREIADLPPIVVVTAVASDDARNLVLDAGADDYLAKPVQPAELLQCLTSCLSRFRHSSVAPATQASQEASVSSTLQVPLVVLVTGAGGPVALQKLFRKLKHGEHASFVIVQHGPHWMLEAFALKLQTQCALRVNVANADARLKRGSVWIAPGGKHSALSSQGDSFEFFDAPEENFVRPSGDFLLRSTLPFAHSVCAVILSGLGCDGVAEARKVMTAGGQLLVQHPATAEVAAMPKAGQSVCGPERVVQLPDIPERIDAWIEAVKYPARSLDVSRREKSRD